MKKVNLKAAAGAVDGYWNPLLLEELNNQSIKMAKIKGEFDWHHHENEDECFLVLEGSFEMHLRDDVIELEEGELLVVPRMIEHKPVAAEEALILLFEPSTTLNTGNVETSKTVPKLKRYTG